jgi:flavin-dependent dehydrogenase
MNDLIDLAIIGGGPAGTAAALEARRRGFQVGLWERDSFPREKVCGEVLSAEALPILAQEIPAALRRAAVIRSAEFISQRGRSYAFTLPEPGAGLSRWMMDDALWRAAVENGARTEDRAAVHAVRRTADGSWILEMRDGGSQQSRFLIVACGRWWTLGGLVSPAGPQRDRSRPDLAQSSWLGVKAHFRGLKRRDAVEMYFFPGGYCGVAPIEDGLYNACCLVHRSLVRDACGCSPAEFASWMKRVARHRALDERLSGGSQASRTVTTAGMRLGRQGDIRNGAILVGDAAGFIDPFTGSGISMALNSGRLAAGILARAKFRPGEMTGDHEVESEYRRKRRTATGRGYAFAALLRMLVSAKAGVQEAAASLISRFGARLAAETRWKALED